MGTLYLIPSLLNEEAIDSLSPSILDAVKRCQVFYVENERSARRYLKRIWKEINIDGLEWHVIANDSDAAALASRFREQLQRGKYIGIISEAGCPGIADPGQALVGLAQEMGAVIKPLVGPNSILLALMASGLNGQQFQFLGYLPIAKPDRIKKIRELESESRKTRSTQVFIETPYRNNQLLESLLASCQPGTRLCIAVDLTAKEEWVRTRTIHQWKDAIPDLHKRPAIFLLLG